MAGQPRVARLDRGVRREDCLKFLEADGAVIVEGFLESAELSRLKAELEPYLSDTPDGEGLFYGKSTKRTGRLFLKSSVMRKVAVHPLLLGIAQDVLGKACSRFQINLTQAIRIGPGERQQIFHRDDEFFPVDNGGSEFMFNVMLAYDDFTDANGATLLVPGSHKRNASRNPDPNDVCAAEMKRGSVLIYLGSVLHCGGANRTSVPRTGVILSYCLGWLRQAENQYLAYPPEVARTFSGELQKLIGYAIHEPNLGWFEGQDPSVTLYDDVPQLLPAKDNFLPSAEAKVEEHYRRLGSS